MKITSNIENSNYTQWITGFVESVINQADLKCDEVIIDELDDKRMWLIIDGAEYAIRTWNFEPVTYDLQGRTCGERVDYTLFKDVSDGNGGGHGEEVCRGVEIIRWNNDAVVEEKDTLGEINLYEELYDDFIPRSEFISRTGIYVSESHFEEIYNYYEECFKDILSVDDFVNSYENEYANPDEIRVAKGTFKYSMNDSIVADSFSEEENPSIYEIVEELASSNQELLLRDEFNFDDLMTIKKVLYSSELNDDEKLERLRMMIPEHDNSDNGLGILSVQENDPRYEWAVKIENDFDVKVPMIIWCEMTVEELENAYNALKEEQA